MSFTTEKRAIQARMGNGAENQNRTDDLFITNELLYQLIYFGVPLPLLARKWQLFSKCIFVGWSLLWVETIFSFSFITGSISAYFMRNLFMSVIFLGIVGYLGSILYERALLSEDEVVTEVVEGVYAYPASVVIKNAEGSEMMVTLLGRSGTHIQFSREDREEFVYPIDSLDSAAQALVRQYPNGGIKNAAVHMAKGSLEVGDLYVQELEKRIREIDKEVADLSRKYGSSNGNTAKRTIRREVERLQAEKVELQGKISERQ